MPESGYGCPVSHKEVVWLTTFSPTSDFLLDISRSPILTSLRPNPLWAEHPNSMDLSQLIPVSIPPEIVPEGDRVPEQRHQHPVAGPNEELQKEQSHRCNSEPVRPTSCKANGCTQSPTIMETRGGCGADQPHAQLHQPIERERPVPHGLSVRARRHASDGVLFVLCGTLFPIGACTIGHKQIGQSKVPNAPTLRNSDNRIAQKKQGIQESS